MKQPHKKFGQKRSAAGRGATPASRSAAASQFSDNKAARASTGDSRPARRDARSNDDEPATTPRRAVKAPRADTGARAGRGKPSFGDTTSHTDDTPRDKSRSKPRIDDNKPARAGEPARGKPRFGDKPTRNRHPDKASEMGYSNQPRSTPYAGKTVRPRRADNEATGAEPAPRMAKPFKKSDNKSFNKPFSSAAHGGAAKPALVSSGVRVERPDRAPDRVARDPNRYGQLLHGMHAVREAWLNPARKCRQLWLSPNAETEFATVLAEAAERKLVRPAPIPSDRAALDALLPGAIHQGIALDADALPELTLADLIAKQPKLIVVLDQVTDPHNVGAILRSAAAFGAEAVVLTERHAPGMTGTLAKSASGALEHVPLVPVVNLARALDQLREAGLWCIGLAEEGEKTIGDHDLSGATALVMGAEGDGLRRLTRERCDALAQLPTQGAISSLNVSNAAAIALYEARRQQK